MAIVLTEEELYGHEQKCPCKECLLTRDFQRYVKNSKVADAFWRGLNRFHLSHNAPVEQYIAFTCDPCTPVRAAYATGMHCIRAKVTAGKTAHSHFRRLMEQFTEEERAA